MDDLLRDEPARLRLDAVREFLALRPVERGSEHHAVAAGLGHILDDEFAEPVEHFLAVLVEHRHVGRRVVQNRLLAEIVADHGGNEIIDGLVVGGAVARRVDDRHIAGSVRGEDSRHADHGIRVERERVEVFVGKTAVDHADAVLLAGIIQEVELVVDHFEVFREGERGAGFLGQIRVFEERGIVPSRRQHDGDAFGGDEIHGFAQQSRIIAVVAHAHVAEQARRDPSFDVACEQRIAGSGRDAQIVFQHPPSAVLPLHQILSGDVGEDATGRRHAVDLREVPGGRVHVFFRNDAVLDGAFVGIDVAQVGVQRVHALFQSGFHPIEFVGFDDARHGVVGEQPIVVFAVLVDAETHPVAAQLPIDGRPAVHQFRCQLTCGGFNHRSTLLLPQKRMRMARLRALIATNVTGGSYRKAGWIVTALSRQ